MQHLNEFLFWLHFSAIPVAIVLAWFLPLEIILFFILLHRLQFIFFDGCTLTKAQRRTGGVTQTDTFFSNMVKRFSGKKISWAQNKAIDYSVIAATIIVSLSKFFLTDQKLLIPPMLFILFIVFLAFVFVIDAPKSRQGWTE